MNNKLLIIFLVLALVPFISAETYKQNTQVDLKIPFEVNGAVASATATCNVSILYPNSTLFVTSSPSTNNNKGIFNITLSSLSTTGEYTWIAFCCDGSNCATGFDKFEVTTTGNQNGLSMFLIGFFASIILLVLAYFFEEEFMYFFSGIAFLFAGVYSMIYGIGDLADLYTRALAGLSLGIGLVLIVSSIYNLAGDREGGGEDYSVEE